MIALCGINNTIMIIFTDFQIKRKQKHLSAATKDGWISKMSAKAQVSIWIKISLFSLVSTLSPIIPT